MTVRAYAFVGSELVPGGPFVGRGDGWEAAYADACAAIGAAVASAHRAALAQPPPEGHVLTVTAIIGGAADDGFVVPGTLTAIQRTIEEGFA